jgi:hypothetical protein
VKLEVEEDARAGGSEFPDDIGSGADEEFLADLERANERSDALCQSHGGIGGGEVQGDNDRVTHS